METAPPASNPGHRTLSVLRGEPDATAARAATLLAALPPAQVLWVSAEPAPEPFVALPPRQVRDRLGATLAAAVLDWHGALDADVLGQCEGLLVGGGRLVLRLPAAGLSALPGDRRLLTLPHRRAEVTSRFAARVERALRATPQLDAPVEPPGFVPRSSEAQRETVEQLTALWRQPTPSRAVLLAERGRGKSSALGLALAGLDPGRPVAITAPGEAAVQELYRFAARPEAPDHRPPFAPPSALLGANTATPEVLVVDEAAQLPVPVLQALVARHPDAHLVFATTTAGYEGTGRGFSLRFVEWLAQQPTPVVELRLDTPIRFAPGCPVERFVYDALLLDAQPAALTPANLEAEPHFEVTDRDVLARDERLLGSVFGLLVQAHYRTSPHDLHALLDAPNLRVHLLRAGRGGPVLAVNLLAREGSLDDASTEALLHGRTRVQGHALTECLVGHLGRAEAGPLSMWRSVRLATHPDARRRGLASLLVEHGHRALDADLFGTLFGLTPELLAFRRSLGYRLVRVGASRGARTGEPSALMVRPTSEAAQALVQGLQRELARDLPTQLELLAAGGDLQLAPAFREALFVDLPAPVAHDDASMHAALRGYTHGPRIYESVATAVQRFVERHPGALDALDPAERSLVEARVCQGRPWPECAERAGLPSVPAAMRALRRALRRIAP